MPPTKSKKTAPPVPSHTTLNATQVPGTEHLYPKLACATMLGHKAPVNGKVLMDRVPTMAHHFEFPLLFEADGHRYWIAREWVK